MQIPDGVLEAVRRYSSRELVAVLTFAYVAVEYNLSTETLKRLASLLAIYLVGQFLVKIAQAVFHKEETGGEQH
ncbi:MAG: hypothetical protein ABIH03_02145 [Pseudomonadota bacterium]